MELTPPIIEKLCSYVRLGANPDTAAMAEGIPLIVLMKWLERGSVESSGIYAELLHRLNQARAQGEILHIQRIVAGGSAKESQWLLERMYPEKWAPKRAEAIKKKQNAAIIDAAFQVQSRRITGRTKPRKAADGSK